MTVPCSLCGWPVGTIGSTPFWCACRPFGADGPIHLFFGLTYAQYIAIPRTALQSMPDEWQRRFVDCLEELYDAIDWTPKGGTYYVSVRDDRGRFVEDPLRDYQRGRRRLPLRDRLERDLGAAPAPPQDRQPGHLPDPESTQEPRDPAM